MYGNEELQKKLVTLAYKRTKPFCYHCYKTAPTGRCATCGSDDLMRELPGVGVEYGTGWVIEHIIKEELTPVDLDEVLEQTIADCYGETTKLGWIEVDTARVIKNEYPTDWRCALSDEHSRLLDDDQAMEIGAELYWTHDVEKLVEDIDDEE